MSISYLNAKFNWAITSSVFINYQQAHGVFSVLAVYTNDVYSK